MCALEDGSLLMRLTFENVFHMFWTVKLSRGTVFLPYKVHSCWILPSSHAVILIVVCRTSSWFHLFVVVLRHFCHDSIELEIALFLCASERLIRSCRSMGTEAYHKATQLSTVNAEDCMGLTDQLEIRNTARMEPKYATFQARKMTISSVCPYESISCCTHTCNKIETNGILKPTFLILCLCLSNFCTLNADKS